MVHMPWLQFACESKPSALHTNAPTAASMHAANACIATPPQDLVTPRGNECSPRAEHLERTRSLADLEAIYASCCPVATVPSRPHVMHAPQPARDGPCNGTSGHDVWFAEQLVELSGLLNSEPGVPRVPTPVPAPVEFDALSCMEGSGSVTAGNTGGHFGGCAPAAADSAAAVTAAAFAACTARSTAAPGSMRLQEGSDESEPVLGSTTPNSFSLDAAGFPELFKTSHTIPSSFYAALQAGAYTCN
jgi:hypothetical protein